VIDEAFALSVLPRRGPDAHKWGVGGLLVVAGAPGYIGAPAMCAMAAARSGAGIVLLAVPRSVTIPVATLVPETVFIPLPEGEADIAARTAKNKIEERLEKARALVIGPGLGNDEHAVALIAELFGAKSARSASPVGFSTGSAATGTPESTANGLVGKDKPAVIDADGLNWLAKQPNWWKGLKPQSLVLTPHVAEMGRLLDCPPEEVMADPVGAARAAAVRWKQVVVLKYEHSVATDGKRALLAPDAPASLATAGTGDVLAGMIGAFLAQGLAPLDAAALALYVGPLAARRVESRVGTLGLVATDLPIAIAEELCVLELKKAGANA
jgi:NAD(P)H-hydrate epimerase